MITRLYKITYRHHDGLEKHRYVLAQEALSAIGEVLASGDASEIREATLVHSCLSIATHQLRTIHKLQEHAQ